MLMRRKRSAIQGLNAELQPQLQRLTMAELAGSWQQHFRACFCPKCAEPGQHQPQGAAGLLANEASYLAQPIDARFLRLLPAFLRRNVLCASALLAQPRTTASVEAALATPMQAIASAKGVMSARIARMGRGGLAGCVGVPNV